jgi:hypothetical protein
MAGRHAFPVVVCLVLLGAGALGAQLATYDFNALVGDDVHPFADLDGQDGWTSQGYVFVTPTASFQMGVTATLGFDGTPALRFEDGGAGVGVEASHLRDASLPLPVFTGNETLVVLQADVYIGYWWGDFALAHDANGDGEIRVPVAASEVGPGVRFGANEPTAGIRVVGADGAFTQVPLATVGDYQDWIRLRLAIDPAAGTGTLLAQNLTAGETELEPVPGLENVPLGLDPAAADGSNPALWDAVFIHFEGLPYQLDNLVFGAVPAPFEIPALSKAGLAMLAAALVGGALVLLRRQRA